jgi:hypothetical protein
MMPSICDTEFLDMFVVYVHTEFHMSNFNGSLVTAVKPKAKFIFRAVIMLLVHSVSASYP